MNSSQTVGGRSGMNRHTLLLIGFCVFLCWGTIIGCAGSSPGGGACTDADSDGYYAKAGCGTDVDCDDADAGTNPAAVELCDGADNDCSDGTADGADEAWYGDACDGADTDLCEEGIYACSGGTQVCTDDTGDSLELCDGADNDCNAATADGADEAWYGDACDGADTDLCEEGTYACSGGTQVCTDDTGDSLELCDGADNDCNAATADGADEVWSGDACDGTDADLCEEGEYICDGGAQACTDNTGNNQELCDGTDNDCNSATADGSEESWLGDACDGPDMDLCEEGYYICDGGARACTDDSADDLEICDDDIDNDCDGLTDGDDPDCGGAIVADHTVIEPFELIPETVIETAKSTYNIFYGHTSHGSQIVSGMEILYDEDGLYAFNDGEDTLQLSEYSDDLGYDGDVSWVPVTRARLDQPDNGINVVMWSWCGGVSDNTVAGINTYLDAMDGLEADYPDVTFVYMTGHLDGTGPAGTLYLRNNQIRDYCVLNDKVLFDFADIESFDPDGNHYPNDDDGCNWCDAWCASNPCPWCASCNHSHCFNCYLKGKAFWWMMARVSGWDELE